MRLLKMVHKVTVYIQNCPFFVKSMSGHDLTLHLHQLCSHYIHLKHAVASLPAASYYLVYSYT